MTDFFDQERAMRTAALWQLTAIRALGIAEALIETDGAPAVHELLREALELERSTFVLWQRVVAQQTEENK